MYLNELMPRLQALHHHNPQAVMTVSAAVAEVEHGLGLLARLGHVYHLEPGPSYSLPEWPRLLFHVQAAPNGRVVHSWWEARELGVGWWPTLQEAQHKEGVRAQFAGRGGIGDRSLPMLVDGGPAGPRPDWGPAIKDNKAIIQEWKDARSNVNGGAEDPNRGNTQQQSPAPPARQDALGQFGASLKGPGVNGAEAGVHAASPAGTDSLSKDGLQIHRPEENPQDRQQLNGRDPAGGDGVLPTADTGADS